MFEDSASQSYCSRFNSDEAIKTILNFGSQNKHQLYHHGGLNKRSAFFWQGYQSADRPSKCMCSPSHVSETVFSCVRNINGTPIDPQFTSASKNSAEFMSFKMKTIGCKLATSPVRTCSHALAWMLSSNSSSTRRWVIF